MPDLLPCQRALFDMPEGIAYLNAAAFTPVPAAVQAAGNLGVQTKVTPWTQALGETEAWADRARAAAANLIGASPADIALTNAVSYGIATAARNITIPPGSRVLMIEAEFPSLAWVWEDLARAANAALDIVPRPANGDWTAALLHAITRPGAPPVGLAALTPLHWADGAMIDLDAILPTLRAQGAAVVIDATQAAGVLDVDVRRWQPDYLAFPTYKWVLGPYSTAFLYAAPHRQSGQPLEQHGASRDPAGLALRDGARRYDRGEYRDPIGLPMAATGLEQILAWTPAAIAARLRRLTDELADAIADIPGVTAVPRALRAPHILGLRIAGGLDGLLDGLAAHHVYVADRLGVLRVSPHVYNHSADVTRFATALRACLAAR